MPKFLQYTIPVTAIIAAMAIFMYLQGRVAWCTCGYIKFWHGVTVSSENSQHLFDWYTFTHIIHGLGFYLLIFLLDRRKKMSMWSKFLLAVGLEAGWEVNENSSFIIDRYRAATISLDYYGDSIINAVGDILAMMAGFWFAAKQKVWFSVILFIVIELSLAYIIRDNLTLNIIMLIHPVEQIRLWQGM